MIELAIVCLTFDVIDEGLFVLLLQLLQCDKCQGCYHAHCIGSNYPTGRSKKKIWVSFVLGLTV